MKLEYQEHCNTGSISALVISPRVGILVAGCTEGYIHLWRTDSNRKLRSKRVHSAPIVDIASSKNGKLLASIAKDKTISVSSIGGALYTPAVATLDTYPSSVSFSPHGTNVAVGDMEGNLLLLDPESIKQTHRVTAHDSIVRAVCYSPIKELLFTCGKHGFVRIWNCIKEPTLEETLTNGGDVTCLALSDDGKHLATGNDLGEVKIWDTSDFQKAVKSFRHSHTVTDTVFHPNNRLFASSDESGKLKLWNLQNKKEVSNYMPELGVPQALAFSSSGNFLYMGTNNGFLEVLVLEREYSLESGPESIPVVSTPSRADTSPRVEVYRGIGVEGAQVVYKVKVRNQSGSVITNVNITVTNYPEDVLKIDGPVTQTISSIGAADDSFRTVTFRFDIIDERCVNESINSTVTYFDHHEAQYTEITRPVSLTSICDLLVPAGAEEGRAEEKFRKFMKAESRITFDKCPTQEAIHDVAEALQRKNFNIVEEDISTKSFTVTGMATGKYTNKGVGAVVRVPLDSVNECETMLLIGAEDKSFLVPLLREIESIVSRTLNRKLEPLMIKLDNLVLTTNRILEEAGISAQNQFKMRKMIRELSRKSDKTSKLAIEYLRKLGEFSQGISESMENLDARVDELTYTLQELATEMDLEESKQEELSGVFGKLKQVITSSGAKTALAWAIRAGLSVLGFHLPF